MVCVRYLQLLNAVASIFALTRVSSSLSPFMNDCDSSMHDFFRDGGGVVSSVDVSIISAPELKFKTQMGTTDLLRSPRPDSCFPFLSLRVK